MQLLLFCTLVTFEVLVVAVGDAGPGCGKTLAAALAAVSMGGVVMWLAPAHLVQQTREKLQEAFPGPRLRVEEGRDGMKRIRTESLRG